MATGVDRVELAYLEHLQQADCPLFGLVRTALGYVLLGPDGMRAISERIAGRVPWGGPDLLSRLPRGRNPDRQGVEGDFRRLALARSVPWRLAAMLGAHLPVGTVYFNIGHSNLTERVLTAVARAGLRTAVMVHDVIPLDFPEYQRPGSVAPFEDRIRRVRAFADVVIYNSADTQNRAEARMASWGAVPEGIVAHLGTNVPVPDPAGLPCDLPPDGPYFVTVGTIEPRKNHAFLLDLWDELGPDAPPLLLCGGRGWNNDAVFARLDALAADHPVREVPGLDDAALAALVRGAAGVLFPSHAEGFGLPLVEAAMLGSRVLCNDLIVFKEVLGTYPAYATVSDKSLWLEHIKSWTGNPPDVRSTVTFDGPTWAEHFKTVLRLR